MTIRTRALVSRKLAALRTKSGLERLTFNSNTGETAVASKGVFHGDGILAGLVPGDADERQLRDANRALDEGPPLAHQLPALQQQAHR
jgi:hypothetical protein